MKKLLEKYVLKRYSISVSGALYTRLRAVTADGLHQTVDGLIASALDDATLCASLVDRVRAAQPAVR